MNGEERLKILLLFSSLVFLGIIFDSCQIDDEHSNHKHHNIKVSEKRFNELIQTQNFKKAMEKIPKIKKRITDKASRSLGISFWEHIKSLLDFDEKNINQLSSFNECVSFYINHFS